MATPQFIDSTALLQSKLDQRGVVILGEPATYVVSKTLIIRSGTHLWVAPGTKIIAAPNSRCALIENEHFCGGGRDADIVIEGGIWDGNCDEQGLDAMTETEACNRIGFAYDPKVFKGKLLRFAHVDNFTIQRLTVKDPVSYGIQLGDSNNFVARDLHFDYNNHFGCTDGIHINGPAAYGLIENLTGVTNDDMVSLTTVDEAHAEVTRGPIHTVEIRNISAEGGYSGVRLLSCGEPMNDVHVCGVYGTYRYNAVLVSAHHVHPGEPVWFDDITIERVHASKSAIPLEPPCHIRWQKNSIEKLAPVWFDRDVKCGYALLRDIYRFEQARNTHSSLICLEDNVEIDRLVMEDIHQSCVEGLELPLVDNRAKINHLVWRDKE